MVLGLIGCGKKEVKDDILVVVNGKPLTAEMVRDAVRVEAKMVEISGQAIPEKDFEQWGNDRALRMVPEIVSSMLVCQAAEHGKIAITTNDLAMVIDAYNRRMGLKAKSKEELVARFGGLSSAFALQFEQTLALTAYGRLYWNFKANDMLVKDHFRLMDEQRKKAAEIDKTARERAASAYKRLQAGEEWDEVAADMSEDRLQDSRREKFSSFWRYIGKNDTAERELVRQLKEMQVGDYTSPLEIADGMVIVRLVEKKYDLFKIARIFFRMSLEIPKCEDKEKVRAEIEGQINRIKRESTLKRLQEQAVFDFPKGTNFVYKFWGKENK